MLDLNFTPFPILATERLILRQLRIEDDNEVYAIRSDDGVNEFLDRPKAKSIEDARIFINKINRGIANNEAMYWAIQLKNSPGLIGSICYWNIVKENDKAEIGYEMNPEFQGKGLMQEAISAVIEFGFSVMKLQSIEACLSAENQKSIKILERNNFLHEPGFKPDKEEESMNLVLYILTQVQK